jgi:hypothetical protein
MSLEELSLFAQVFGLVLVAASLVFVGFQMRQTHAIERANAQRDLLNQSREWWMLGVESEQMFDTISSGLQDFRGLSRFQQAQFHAWSANLLQLVTGVYFQHRAKLINPSSHEGFMRAFLSILNTPGGRQWWQISGDIGNREVATYMNARLAAEAATLPVWTDLLPHYRPPLLQQTAAAEKATA